MSNKKRMILVLTAVMVLFVAVGSFAATELTFNGSCKKCFLSSKYIEKTSSESWSLFTVTVSKLEGSTSGTAQARPETSAGKTCGTRFSISTSKATEYLPNDRGTSTNQIHVKIYTNEYADKGQSASTAITVEGKMTGTK